MRREEGGGGRGREEGGERVERTMPEHHESGKKKSGRVGFSLSSDIGS